MQSKLEYSENNHNNTSMFTFSPAPSLLKVQVTIFFSLSITQIACVITKFDVASNGFQNLSLNKNHYYEALGNKIRTSMSIFPGALR